MYEWILKKYGASVWTAFKWLRLRYGRAGSHRLLTAKARVGAQVSPCAICGCQSGSGTGFPPIPSVFPCQYYSTAAPYLLTIIWGMDNGPVRGPFPQIHSLTPSQQGRRDPRERTILKRILGKNDEAG
jgi:hypothetical protein